MSQTLISIVNARGKTLYGRAWKNTQKPEAIVYIIHGLGEHIGRYRHLAEQMNQQNLVVLGFDLKGHGLSKGKRGHFQYEQAIDALDNILLYIKKEYPNVPIILLGHSMGGNIALSYLTEKQPDIKGIIVNSPWIRLTHPPSIGTVGLAWIMTKLFPAYTQANGLEPGTLSHDLTVAEHYKSDPLVHDRISAGLFYACYKRGQALMSKKHKINIPLLLMHGTDDDITDYKVTEQFAKMQEGDITLKLWDGQYHETHQEFIKEKVIGFMIEWTKERL